MESSFKNNFFLSKVAPEERSSVWRTCITLGHSESFGAGTVFENHKASHVAFMFPKVLTMKERVSGNGVCSITCIMFLKHCV